VADKKQYTNNIFQFYLDKSVVEAQFYPDKNVLQTMGVCVMLIS